MAILVAKIQTVMLVGKINQPTKRHHSAEFGSNNSRIRHGGVDQKKGRVVDVERPRRELVVGLWIVIPYRRGASKERARSRSVDRNSISRPRRDSVDESSQFQQMMKRINKVSASSPG